MRQTIITNPQELFELIDKYRSSTTFKFRGHSRRNWELTPKAGRDVFKERKDKEIFRHWKRRAKSILNKELSSDIHLLTIAQHFGLATRLLDWSLNPLIATYFACHENQDKDGELFIIRFKQTVQSDQLEDPFENMKNSVRLVQPESSSGRLDNQLGYFSIHNPPSLEVKKSNTKHLESIIIPSETKRELIFILNQYGINNMTIYPDIEGLTKHLNWFYENYDYWTTS